MNEFYTFADRLKKLKVADLLKYARLTRIFERFEEAKGSKAGANKHFRTIGYTIVEEALLEGDRLTVLGVVTSNNESPLQVSIGAPRSKSMVDLKSDRIKPFIISTQSVSDLLHGVEMTALVQVIKITCLSTVGLSVTVFALFR